MSNYIIIFNCPDTCINVIVHEYNIEFYKKSSYIIQLLEFADESDNVITMCDQKYKSIRIAVHINSADVKMVLNYMYMLTINIPLIFIIQHLHFFGITYKMSDMENSLKCIMDDPKTYQTMFATFINLVKNDDTVMAILKKIATKQCFVFAQSGEILHVVENIPVNIHNLTEFDFVYENDRVSKKYFVMSTHTDAYQNYSFQHEDFIKHSENITSFYETPAHLDALITLNAKSTDDMGRTFNNEYGLEDFSYSYAHTEIAWPQYKNTWNGLKYLVNLEDWYINDPTILLRDVLHKTGIISHAKELFVDGNIFLVKILENPENVKLGVTYFDTDFVKCTEYFSNAEKIWCSHTFVAFEINSKIQALSTPNGANIFFMTK